MLGVVSAFDLLAGQVLRILTAIHFHRHLSAGADVHKPEIGKDLLLPCIESHGFDEPAPLLAQQRLDHTLVARFNGDPFITDDHQGDVERLGFAG